MANRYWVGGTGNWDSSTTTHWSASSGGAGGASVPGTGDDVFFDSASNATDYTVTITQTAQLANLNIGAPASGKVTWAGSSAMSIYGSLNLSGGTAGITCTYTGIITFRAVATGKTITLNGVVLSSQFVFDGVGGGWTLQDTCNLGSNIITLTRGSLDTNNVTVTCTSFLGSNSNTRSLTLGTSTINCGSWTFTTTTGLTFSGASSTINCTTNGVTFAGGGLTYGTVTSSNNNSSFTVTGSNTFANLSYSVVGGFKTIEFILSGTQTITGTFTSGGSSSVNRILIRSATPGTAATISAGTVTIVNADLQDITGAGAGSWNLSAISGLSGDCGGNSGITFTTPASQTWTNTSGGSWSTAANWTSRVPLPQDDVSLNCAFTTSRTVTADMPRLGKGIDWTGATWTTLLTFSISQNSAFFGSFTLISGLTQSGTFTFQASGRGSFTINTNGVSLVAAFSIIAPGNTYTQASDLTLSTSRSFSVSAGTYLTNGFVLSAGSFSTGPGTTLNLGTATHLVTGPSTTLMSINAGTIVGGTSTIKLTDTGSGNISLSLGGDTYNNIWFARGASTGSITISGSNTFNDFKDTGSAAHSILFTTGTTQTVTTFTVNGTAGNLITINSTTTGTHTLSAPSKNNASPISCDYLNIQHSIVLQANTWYAGVNSVNNQATATAGSGWIFTAPAIVLSDTSSFFQLF